MRLSARKRLVAAAVALLLSVQLFILSACSEDTHKSSTEPTSAELTINHNTEPATEAASESAETLQKRLSLTSQVEEYMANYDFSGSILISVDGDTLCEYSRGFADKANATPNTPSTRIEIGSMTKQFTAAAILMLQEQGRLNVLDTVDEYIPEYDFGGEMTVENLLNMTSGIPDFLNSMLYLDAIEEIDLMEPTNFNEVLEFANYNGLEFTPGTSFQYSNTNYLILGEIVARLSGSSYETFVEENILKPLGMSNTSMNMNSADAVGYLADGSEGDTADTTYFGAAGEMVSTVGDINLWLCGLTEGKVLSESSLNQMLSNTAMGYGYGWFIVEDNYYWHTGQSMSCYTMDLMSADFRVNVVVLSNVDDENVETICVDLYNMAEDY